MSVERYISICWENVQRRNSAKREFLYVTEVPALIDELLDFVGVASLITKDEKLLLQKIIQNKPLLRIQRSEVESFLLRLVRCRTTAELLLKRAHTSEYELKRLVDAYPSSNHTLFGRFRESSSQAESTGPKIELDFGRPRSEHDERFYGSREPYRVEENRFSDEGDSAFRRKPRDLFLSMEPINSEPKYKFYEPKKYRLPGEMDFDEKAPAVTPENSEDSTVTRMWQKFKRGNDTLFGRFWPKTDDFTERKAEDPELKQAKNLNHYDVKLDKSTFLRMEERQLHKKIEELELLCQRYERTLAESKHDEQTQLIEDLKQAIEKQNKLIMELERKVKFSSNLSYVHLIPLVRELVMLYAYNDGNSIGTIFLGILAMFFMFTIVSNALKCIYYVSLALASLFQRASASESDCEQLTFSLSGQWPWLEYKYDQVMEWMGY